MLAASRVIDRKGYANAGIMEIAGEAGASRATFYLHFSSKVDLVRALMDPLLEDAMGYYGRLPAMMDPTWEQIRDWFDEVIHHWEDHHVPIGAVQQGAANEPELAQALMRVVSGVAEFLAPWLAGCAGIDEDLAKLRATLWILETERTAYFWKIRQISFDRDLVLDVLADSLWVSLQPPSRSRMVRR